VIRVKVLSRMEVVAGGAEGVDAVISIRGRASAAEPELTIALAQATRGESARLLKLSFDDIGMPHHRHFVGPSMAQIADAVEFGRSIADGRLLFDGPGAGPPLIAIHCEQGESRSAAIAVALLADQFGDGREREAVNALMRDDIEQRMHPNPLAISLADACLFRYGRIDAALAELCPRYVRWRELWRQIIAEPDADRARTSRSGRRGPVRSLLRYH
jgi:predicted protein tyrosine phosphatase